MFPINSRQAVIHRLDVVSLVQNRDSRPIWRANAKAHGRSRKREDIILFIDEIHEIVGRICWRWQYGCQEISSNQPRLPWIWIANGRCHYSRRIPHHWKRCCPKAPCATCPKLQMSNVKKPYLSLGVQKEMKTCITSVYWCCYREAAANLSTLYI